MTKVDAIVAMDLNEQSILEMEPQKKNQGR